MLTNPIELEVHGIPKVAILLIDEFSATCSLCGAGAFPNEAHHDTVADGVVARPEPGAGCGALFVALASMKVPGGDVQRTRPELPVVNIHR